MNIQKVKVNIGLEKPIKILHITDVHLAYMNKHDIAGDDQKYRCEHYFTESLGYLREAVAYAKGLDFAIFTGDAVDAALFGCLELFQKETADLNYIYACGNHEYLLYVFGPEDKQSMAEAVKRCEPYIKGDIHFNAQLVGGVNLITLDDAFYQFSQEQLDRLKQEAAKGYPMVLFMHAPLFEESAAEPCQKRWNGRVEFYTAMPEEAIKKYNSPPAIAPSKVTQEMTDYIFKNDQIKAVFAGHLHFNHAGMLPGGKMQYILNGLHDGDVYEIEIV